MTPILASSCFAPCPANTPWPLMVTPDPAGEPATALALRVGPSVPEAEEHLSPAADMHANVIESEPDSESEGCL